MKLNNVSGKSVVAAATVAAVSALSANPSLAALSTEEQSMVTAVTTKFADIASAIGTMAVSNLGIAIAVVIGSLIIGYALKAGRG